MTKRESLIIQNPDISITNVSLGNYLEGYSNTKDKYPYHFLWWLLFPVFGWIVVFVFTLTYFLMKLFNTRHYIFLYKNGILWKVNNLFGKKEMIIRYDSIGNILISKTRFFVYGLIYSRTEMSFEILDKTNKRIKKISIAYRNKAEEDDGYNSLGFALHRIYVNWACYSQLYNNTEENNTRKSIVSSKFQI